MKNLFGYLVVAMVASGVGRAAELQLPTDALLLDLDADRGVEVRADGRVSSWTNQAAFRAKVFKATRADGLPSLRKNVAELSGHNAMVFQRQELLNDDEDAFDGLITGSGHTWVSVLCAYVQKPQLKDVNTFFGNLRSNGRFFEGIWGNFNDDGSIWIGPRNGISFGRWNNDNPKIDGPKFEPNRYYIAAGRLAAGTKGAVSVELFVNAARAVTTTNWPVNPKANSSVMVIGQERDARNHPGKEAFDGEIARMLIWQRPLSDAELAGVMTGLKRDYGIRD